MTDARAAAPPTPAEFDKWERQWTAKAMRALRVALAKPKARERVLRGLSYLMYEAHMNGRIHGKKPFGSGPESRKLWLDALVAFVKGLDA